MGRLWKPLALSLAVHGVIIYLLAKQSMLHHPADKETVEPIKAKLYFPPVVIPPKQQVKDKPEPEPEPEPVPETEPEPAAEAEPLPEAESKPQPKPQPETQQQATPSAAPTANSEAPAQLSVAESTRRALSRLQDDAMNDMISNEKGRFDSRDARIISESPRIDTTSIKEIERHIMTANCDNTAKKLLVAISATLMWAVKCRSYSTEDIQSFIDKHDSSKPLPYDPDSENDQEQ